MSERSYPTAAFDMAGTGTVSTVATVTGGIIGNIIEWYDWTIYGLLASVFASQFFPSSDRIVALLLTLSTFALGFLMRPVGSIVLSPMADRYGRRRMLALTILLMGLGSLIVAVTPPYSAIGIAAPLLLLFARLVQGFSAGGEFQGGATFLVEHAPPNRRGFTSSFHIGGVGVSVLIATGVSALTTGLIPQPALGSWGWRIPFLFGAVLSLYGLYIRSGLPETPHFVEAERNDKLEAHPIRTALTNHPWESFVVFVMQMGTVQFYIWVVFLPTYAHLAGGLPLTQGFIGGIIALIVFCIATPISGAVSDRIGRKPLLLGYAIGFFVLSWPDAEAAGQRRFLELPAGGCRRLPASGHGRWRAVRHLVRVVPDRGTHLWHRAAIRHLRGHFQRHSTANRDLSGVDQDAVADRRLHHGDLCHRHRDVPTHERDARSRADIRGAS